MEVDSAYKMIERAIQVGRPANAYLIVGSLDGMAKELSDRVLHLLFGDVDLKAHPDIHWLFPEKASRIISTYSIREKLIEPVALTSFEGGWRAGVILGADRLKKETANAFLKTLEEPPPKTLFLLLTEQPEQLLPTIISRCQQIALPDVRWRTLSEPYRSQVLAVLADAGFAGVTAREAAAARLAKILEALKRLAEKLVKEEIHDVSDGPGEEITDDDKKALISSRYRDFRVDFLVTLVDWFRDLMAVRAAPPRRFASDDGALVPLVNESMRPVLEERAAHISLAEAFRNVEAVELLSTSFERNVSERMALALWANRIATGAEVRG